MKRVPLPLLESEVAPAGCGPVKRSSRAWKRALVLLAVHGAIAAHLVHWQANGTTLTPLEPSEAGETLTTGAINAGFVLLVLLILSTLVLGRFFCGWACHVVAYQDACAWLLARLGWKPKPIRSRLLVFVPLLAAFEMFALPSLQRFLAGHGFPELSWHLTTDSFWERFPGPWIALTTLLVAGFALVWFFGAKGFCTYGCPYGALFGVAERVAPGRIRVTDACEGCGHCTAVCTSNVRVHQEVREHGMVVDAGCMKCLDCVSVCPKEALYFGFGPLPKVSQRAKRRFDFGWGEELLLALVFGLAIYAFRGLYGAVPLLLAIGLALLAAGSAVALARLVRRRELKWQHVALKRAGRLTRGGALACALFPGLLAFTGHSAFVQWQAREGNRALSEAAALARGSSAWNEAVERAARHLSRASAAGLVPSAELENKLGQVLVARGASAEAETHLARAAELDPRNKSARLFLAHLLSERGAMAAACARLLEVHALDPADPQLASSAAALAQRAPQDPAVRALLLELAVR
ncbi:MAG: 4Fe-4S binding protein [Planctomycetes bacterium]|nr:4Fe-4S binding protein [Planctomycetota bacterium]